jgi:hypothetical protein
MSSDEPEHDIDVEIVQVLARPSGAEWAALWEAVEAVRDMSDVGSYGGGSPIPYFVYSGPVDLLLNRLLAMQLSIGFDYMHWDRCERYEADLSALADAPVGDAPVSSWRSNDGSIGTRGTCDERSAAGSCRRS